MEDAKAAGFVLTAAVEQTGLNVTDWLKRVRQPINPTSTSTIQIERDGNPEGPLFGEVLVFTGSLEVPRREAADMAARIGCRVEDNVTKRTTLLIVGDQDIRKLAGHKKSSKHRRVEQLLLKGQSIRILTEKDFIELVHIDG